MKKEKKIIFGKADLHVHSKYSWDSLSPIENILKQAKKREIDIIAITDHNTIEGAKKAQSLSKKFGVEVVIGEEITTKEGDLIALFIKDLVAPYQSALSTIKEIHKQGGLAIIPHPDNCLLNSMRSCTSKKAFIEVDGIEFFNGSTKAWFGNIHYAKLKRLNKAVYKKAIIGGSDAHLTRHVGCCHTLFIGNKPKDLYLAIKERTTTAHGSVWNYRDRIFYLIAVPKFACRNFFYFVKKRAKKLFKA